MPNDKRLRYCSVYKITLAEYNAETHAERKPKILAKLKRHLRTCPRCKKSPAG